MIYVEHHIDPSRIKVPMSNIFTYTGLKGNLYIPSSEVFGGDTMRYFRFPPFGGINKVTFRYNRDVVEKYRYNMKDPE